MERGALRDWVWTALERLPEPQRVAVMLRHFSAASSYIAIADICDVPVGTVRSQLKRGPSPTRRRAARHRRDRAHRARHCARLVARGRWGAAGLRALRRPALLDSVFTPDIAFRMADRVERRGRADLAAGLAHDFDDGVTTDLLRVVPGEHVATTDLLLESPTDTPLHCPPAVTQVHFHHAGRTHRLVSYYASHP